MLRITRTRTLQRLRDAAAAGEIDAAEAEKLHEQYETETHRADELWRELDEARCSVEVLRELEGKLTGERDDLRDDVERLTEALQRATAERDEARGDLEAAQRQVLLDAEDRVALRTLLRIVRQQSRTADRVYALFQRGELHSVHLSLEAAEAAAEAEGAPPSGWFTFSPGAAQPPASEVTWRVQPLRVGGPAA